MVIDKSKFRILATQLKKPIHTYLTVSQYANVESELVLVLKVIHLFTYQERAVMAL